MATGTTGTFLKPRVAAKSHAKVVDADILAFFQQLATLFRAGTPIYEALSIAATQTQSRTLAAAVDRVARQVAGGLALHAALAEQPKIFKEGWIEIIRSGEDSGKLGEVLDRLAEQIEAAAQLKSKITSAMMYPAILAIVAVLAVVVMLVKVVPTFESMFEQLDKELPEITLMVVAASDFLRHNAALLAGGAVALVVFLRAAVRTEAGRLVRDQLFVCMPLVGDLTVQTYMQRYANTMGMSMNAGLTLLESIDSLKGIFKGNQVYARSLRRVAQHVGRGGTLADGIEKTGLFTSFVVRMTRIGEQSGTLSEVMAEVETFYARKVEVVVQRMTGTLETVVILFMGFTVAVILCAIYMPMFSMASGV